MQPLTINVCMLQQFNSSWVIHDAVCLVLYELNANCMHLHPRISMQRARPAPHIRMYSFTTFTSFEINAPFGNIPGIPLITACYLLALLDRANLGAVKEPISTDLGMSEQEFALASGLFFATYIPFIAPMNMLTRRCVLRQ